MQLKTSTLHHGQTWRGNLWGNISIKVLQQHRGHHDQEFKNIRSTKPTEDLGSDVAPSQEPNNIKTSDIMCTVIVTDDICISYSDQAGNFLITSSGGHKYIFVFYHYDTNSIIGIPIKSFNTSALCDTWQETFDMFKSHSETPNIHILDNKCSSDMKDMFENKKSSTN